MHALDARLMEILACPAEDHAPLRQVETPLAESTMGAVAELECTSCGRRYPIVDGIPVLLLPEAEPAEPAVGTETE